MSSRDDSKVGEKILVGAASVVVGSVALAALGGLLGGPPGAVIGAKVGAALGGGKGVSGS